MAGFRFRFIALQHSPPEFPKVGAAGPTRSAVHGRPENDQPWLAGDAALEAPPRTLLAGADKAWSPVARTVTMNTLL